MMKEKLRKLTDTSLKELALTGYLSLPLRVGERALIIQGGQHSLLTSPVRKILEVSQYGIVFQTCNTIYRLSYTPVPNENEVMCA